VTAIVVFDRYRRGRLTNAAIEEHSKQSPDQQQAERAQWKAHSTVWTDKNGYK
jgi:hypothetical protein